MRMVMKFGGTSLENEMRLHLAASRVAEAARAGNQVVAVVSAQGNTTDEMLDRAHRICEDAPARELDAYLAAGEQMSAALMAMALHSQGIHAVSMTGWQAGIHTDGAFGDAGIESVDPACIRSALDAGAVAVVAGFQGVDAEDEITTLGRGGSDTTAVVLAAALQADCCRIYTDVDGVYDKDPQTHADAHRFHQISYAAMLALARSGAQVLHDRCVEIAQKNRIPIEVLSAFTGEPGTMVMD